MLNWAPLLSLILRFHNARLFLVHRTGHTLEAANHRVDRNQGLPNPLDPRLRTESLASDHFSPREPSQVEQMRLSAHHPSIDQL